jgi:TolA-binding protein
VTTTPPNTDPADRLADLADQQRSLIDRRTAMERELTGIEQATADASRLAADAIPALASRRAALERQARAATADRLADLAAGRDTSDATRRTAELITQIQLLDADIEQVRRWSQQAQAEADRERQQREYQQTMADLAAVDQAVVTWADRMSRLLDVALNSAAKVADGIITAVRLVNEPAARSQALRARAASLAAQLGQEPPPPPPIGADPLDTVATAARQSNEAAARLVLAAAAGSRYRVLAALAPVVEQSRRPGE